MCTLLSSYFKLRGNLVVYKVVKRTETVGIYRSWIPPWIRFAAKFADEVGVPPFDVKNPGLEMTYRVNMLHKSMPTPGMMAFLNQDVARRHVEDKMNILAVLKCRIPSGAQVALALQDDRDACICTDALFVGKELP